MSKKYKIKDLGYFGSKVWIYLLRSTFLRMKDNFTTPVLHIHAHVDIVVWCYHSDCLVF